MEDRIFEELLFAQPVMDPMSGLSVATSVIQFVDFTVKLVQDAHEIYVSATRDSERNSELKAVTHSLVQLNKDLEKSLNAKSKSPSDAQLVPLCAQCNELAQKLIDALNKLSVQSRSRAWGSFQQALKTIWNQSDIDGLQRRLDSFRQQLTMHLLVSLR